MSAFTEKLGAFASSDGWKSGTDLLDKTLGTYFTYKQAEAGLELQQAQAQQARTNNTVAVAEQINARAVDIQAEKTGVDMKRYAIFGAFGLLGVAVLFKVISK